MSSVPELTIIRSNRRTVALQVTSTGDVVVKAPMRTSMSFINSFIEKNKEWIDKKMQQVTMRTHVADKRYVTGDTFLYLGKPVALTIGPYTAIHVQHGKLYFPQGLHFRIEKELKAWFIKQARDIITAQVEMYAKEMRTGYTDITFSDTKSQWGRCTHDNRLQFSWRLVMAPLLTLNYVVIHELAHTMEKNHSRAFWSKVRLYNPSFKQQIKWLQEHGHELVI